jgi:hypothetical protein
MSTTTYDPENNVLHINKDDEKRKLRGFILTIANSQADAEAVMQGDHNKMQLAPVMAPNEEEAIKLLGSQGKVVLGIASYEYLLFQKSLIEDLSKHQDIELVSLDLFKKTEITD